MSSTTPNYGFKVPSDDDYQKNEDIVEPVTQIDSKIKELNDLITSLSNKISGTNGPSAFPMVTLSGTAQKKIHFQTIGSSLTGATGLATFNHSAGFDPSAVFVYGADISDHNAICQGTDLYTTTQFRARFSHANGSGALVTANTGSIVAMLVS